MPSIEIIGVSNDDESGDNFRKQWESTINLDVVDDMDKEQLDELARILDKLK
tara:strand:+ start:4180 stop:4335 length:156 start_codon:yes stop_codon:yes gene_type:complete